MEPTTTNIQKTVEQQMFDISDYDTMDKYSSIDIAYNQDMLIGLKPRITLTTQITSTAGYRIAPNETIGLQPVYQRYIAEEEPIPTPVDALEFIPPYSEDDKINDRECHPINWNSSCKY
jgi:hypothetical protein